MGDVATPAAQATPTAVVSAQASPAASSAPAAAAPPSPAPAAAATPAAPATPAATPGTPASTATPANPSAPAGDAKPGETKPGEPKPTVPATYALKLPDGSPLDAAHVDKLTSFAKEKGLTPELAQAVLARDHEQAVARRAEFEAQKKAWGEQLAKDPKYGGQNLVKTGELARRVLTKFFPPNFAKVLDDTGAGNYPDLVIGLAQLGQAYGEDKLPPLGQPSGIKEGKPTTPAQRFYPKMKSAADSA